MPHFPQFYFPKIVEVGFIFLPLYDYTTLCVGLTHKISSKYTKTCGCKGKKYNKVQRVCIRPWTGCTTGAKTSQTASRQLLTFEFSFFIFLHQHAQHSSYYRLSLFNSCSLNAPDNDKAPQSLTTSLLTLSLLSLSASHSRHSLRFVSIVWHSRTIWQHPQPPLKHRYSSQVKPVCEREIPVPTVERTICRSLGTSDTSCHLLVM